MKRVKRWKKIVVMLLIVGMLLENTGVSVAD